MKPTLLAAFTAMALSGASVAMAEGMGKAPCPPQTGICRLDQAGPGTTKNHVKADSKAGHGQTKATGRAVQVGDSGAMGQRFRQADNSRFKTPPRGQEYRVINDRLVLVNKDTLKVVAVLGLLSALTN